MHFFTHPCLLGRLLLGAGPTGVRALYFGDDDAELLAELSREFSTTPVRDESLILWAELVARQLTEGGVAPVPLDVAGTDFQKRVWNELRRIPPGETRTYTQVAEALGAANAVRAVGRACATNPVSLLIPCHRVLRVDGGLGGYRWGLARKQRLIDDERRHAARRRP